jgi:hypothetical protein
VLVQLAPPWRVAAGPVALRGTARARKAVRIRLHDAEGQSGVGEALPLPGYSRDDAETAERLLAALLGVVLEVPDSTTGVACLAATLAPLEACSPHHPARVLRSSAPCSTCWRAAPAKVRPHGWPKAARCSRCR